MAAYQLVDATYGDGTPRSLPIDGVITYIFTGEEIIDTDEDLDNYTTLKTLSAGEISTQGGVDLTVTPISDRNPVAGFASELLEIAEDAAADITDEIGTIVLASSASGSKAITTSSSTAGQIVRIQILAQSGGNYTLATDSGALTFDDINDWGQVVRNNANDEWLFMSGTAAAYVS